MSELKEKAFKIIKELKDIINLIKEQDPEGSDKFIDELTEESNA